MKQSSSFLSHLHIILLLTTLLPFTGCAYLRIDLNNVLLRSDVIASPEQASEIVSRAKLDWTDDGKIRVLYVSGTPYERGYQQGVLLRKEIQDNFGFLYKRATTTFHSDELFAEVYERMRPYIPQEYIDEMHGIAHGAKIPLAVIHHIHVLADMGEWGGKKRVKEVVKQMMRGEIGTMCSNIGAFGAATADNKLYAVRILDWGLHKISKLHQYPMITVNVPKEGIASANIGWVGYLGAVSGINAEGITLGEMGYRDPEGETLRGIPMPFMLRDVLSNASSLKDVRQILKEAPGSNSYAFLMTDGKAKQAEFYIKDRYRFLTFEAGKPLTDFKENIPAIPGISYGGRYNDKLTTHLSANQGKLTPQLFMEEIIPQVVMKSNFQNVVYSPEDLTFWVNNARSKDVSAANQPYTFFDLRKGLQGFQEYLQNKAIQH